MKTVALSSFFVLFAIGSIAAVGASGAISGILGAYLALFPRARIMTFLMLGFFWRMMHIQAKWFLPFWLIFQNILPFLISGFGVAGGGVAFMAHIGGFVIGFAFGYFYKKNSRLRIYIWNKIWFERLLLNLRINHTSVCNNICQL